MMRFLASESTESHVRTIRKTGRQTVHRRALLCYPATRVRPRRTPPNAFAPNYNITPDSFQPVVRLSHETGEREFARMKWGLAPGWSKTPKATFSLINARADNLETSGAWREPFKRRHCLIPAEFFYEWEPEKPKAPTQPWAVALSDDRLFSFVGVWDWSKDKTTGDALESFAIVTVDPNEVLI